MTNHVLHAPPVQVNLSPFAFRMWARHYKACRHTFIPLEGFSPVPYFLNCRAIELGLKAHLLEHATQSDVKRYSHDIERVYAALPGDLQTLSEGEFQVLRLANQICRRKGFEYFNVEMVMTGGFTGSEIPSLSDLDAITLKLVPDELPNA